MNKYLLDTNICIYYLKGRFNLNSKIEIAGSENCFLSEITVTELKFGVENSTRKEENRKALDIFIPQFSILPIYNCLDIYAQEKQG